MQITPSAGGTTVISNVFFIGGAIGNGASGNLGGTMALLTGDKIELVTQDLSVGGTCGYNASAKLTEYDS